MLSQLRDKIIKKEYSRMNAKQFEAVTTVNGPLLILAGAGSGKTTVLVNRIAYLIKYGDAYGHNNFRYPVDNEDYEILSRYYNGEESLAYDAQRIMSYNALKPWEILAITFTNKAANEMKERVEKLVGDVSKDMWIGTFHSICVKILRRQIDRIGFDTSFVIFDSSDQKTMIKKIIKEQDLDDKMFSDRSVLTEISNAKNEMLTPEQYLARANGEYRKEKIAEV